VAKLLLISTLLVTIILPIVTSYDQNPQRGMRRCMTGFFIFIGFWVFALLFIYPRLLAMSS
jgi:hypothetical protein